MNGPGSGCFIRAAMLATKEYGVCSEASFPYPGPHRHPDDVQVVCPYQPSHQAMAEAKSRRKKLRPIKIFPTSLCSDGEYRSLVDPYQRIYTLRAALARGHPIACALR